MMWIARNRAKLRRRRDDAPDPVPQGGQTSLSAYPDLFEVLKRQGLVILPELFSTEFCDRGRDEIDRLIRTFPDAVHRVSNESDCRVFGAENGSDALGEFARDNALLGTASQYLGTAAGLFCMLANRIEGVEGNTGSGDGWHRDSLVGQYKAIIYLSDVTVENGPFQFIARSHRLGQILRDCATGGFKPLSNRLSEVEINPVIQKNPERLITATANAGTVILVDTTGVHRGSPLLGSVRYALTNYYYPRAHLNKGLEDHFAPILGVHVTPGST